MLDVLSHVLAFYRFRVEGGTADVLGNFSQHSETEPDPDGAFTGAWALTPSWPYFSSKRTLATSRGLVVLIHGHLASASLAAVQST